MFNMSKYSDWQKQTWNRNFHILHNLIKNEQINKVIAVDFLPFNFKRAIKTYIQDQIIKDIRGSIIYGDLTSRCWQISSKIMVYSTIDSLINPQKITKELNIIVKEQDMGENLIVWNYNPLYIDYFNKLKQKLNIFDTVDNWLEHSSYKNKIKILDKNYQKILADSDIIFTVSKSLKENLFHNKDQVHWIPNAVDLEYFQSQTETHPLLRNIAKPIIGFLGILQDRINNEIIEYLAKKNPQYSIVLAGPVWKSFPKNHLEKYPNIYFTGPVSGQDIPKLYNEFSLGIIPYKTNKFIKSTDSMKFYEYLAKGLPIVSTPIQGIERFQKFIQVASTPEQFNQQVNQAIQNRKSINQSEVNDFLSQHTWQNRIEKMLNLINQKI